MYVKHLIVFIFGLTAALSASAQQEDCIHAELHAIWHVLEDGNDIAYPATVPGNVYTDLLAAGAIPDPFIGNNEQEVQWVGEKNWTYTTSPFDISPATLEKEELLLRFEGLDTYANVWLNDQHILSANNYHRYWDVDVKGILKSTDNILEIHFKSPLVIGEVIAATNGQSLPGDELRAVTRKPQFHYGWDWGPKLLTMGIHKPIQLMAYNYARVLSSSTEVPGTITESFGVRATVEIECAKDFPGDWALSLGHHHHSGKQQLKKGINTIVIDDPGWSKADLWEPGRGAQSPYKLRLELTHKGEPLLTYSTTFGLRTAELITTPDEHGESFYFEINGQPIFTKGANYIPLDFFPNRVSPEDYERLLNDVVFSNMNMLRVWGGAIYEEDYFYHLCDSLGIMVWQDFMYACAMYPGDEAFLENARIEAEQQVKRLANHPSIVLWCGNNENSEGWHRWGWQSGMSKKEKKATWKAYEKLFCKILPSVVEDFDDVAYWESSPLLGRGDPKHQFSGDAHYWGVWHDGQPFDTLNIVVPRFMSEFGFQSFPQMSTILSFADSTELDFSSPSILNHEKHPRGLELIRQYMMEDYGIVPENFEDFVWLSQVVQAEGIGLGLEAHRRNAPYCMGTLYWQLNDCWPVASWSSIDYYGNWKPLLHRASEVFAPYTISTEIVDGRLKVFVILDEKQSFPCPTHLWLKTGTTDGEIIREIEAEGPEIDSFSNLIWEGDISELCVNQLPQDVVLKLEVRLIVEGDLAHSLQKVVTLVPPKTLNLQSCEVTVDIKPHYEAYEIKLHSDCFTKGLWLMSDTPGWFLENFFDLFSGEYRTVYFFPDDPEQIPQIRIRSLNHLLQSE